MQAVIICSGICITAITLAAAASPARASAIVTKTGDGVAEGRGVTVLWVDGDERNRPTYPLGNLRKFLKLKAGIWSKSWNSVSPFR